MSTQTLPVVSPDGFRDLTQMDRALRHYRAARSEMASTRRPVLLSDKATGTTLQLETMRDVRMLLFAAAAAYRGARTQGLADAAELVLADIRRVKRTT